MIPLLLTASKYSREDFLISPFGLHYYMNTIREYWLLQEFFPQAMDDPNPGKDQELIVGFGVSGFVVGVRRHGGHPQAP